MGFNINGFGKEEKSSLVSVAKDMLASWLGKPQEQSTGEWLSDKLTRHLGAEAEKVAETLMTGISSFNDSLQQIDENCANGNKIGRAHV